MTTNNPLEPTMIDLTHLQTADLHATARAIVRRVGYTVEIVVD